VQQQLVDVIATRTQRWHFDTNHVKAMQEIFAKQPLCDPRFQSLVRGSDDSHLDSHWHLATDTVELAFRQHPEQPRLQLRRHVTYLIQEQGAAIRLLEASATQLIGASLKFIASRLRMLASTKNI